MNNGIADWTPLAGDPGCTMTIGEWADEMVVQLQKMPMIKAMSFMSNLTQEERDIIQARLHAQGVWS